uniref:Uncharacterized protein n=1 Tax=Spongospora subterranea TaxID=70186 RepID=A0A0H5RAL1_9EUKA|eukprot:CRZ11200.1 hypothetical protein [Spongospora subterranea]
MGRADIEVRGNGVAVDELGKDLRLAAELGASLLSANEQLQVSLNEALEREAYANKIILDLRKRLSASDEEILTLTAELADAQDTQLRPQHGRRSSHDQRVEFLENALTSLKEKFTGEREQLSKKAELIKSEAEQNSRDIEAMRAHCFDLEAKIESMSRSGIMLELKSFARQRRLEIQLSEANERLEETRSALKSTIRSESLQVQNELASLQCESERLKDVIRSMSVNKVEVSENVNCATSLFCEIQGNCLPEPIVIGKDRNGGNVLVEFFFLTAMACKLDMVDKGLASQAFAVTNEELYDAMNMEERPVPFFGYHDWIRSRLEHSNDNLEASRQQPQHPESFWSILWKR